MLEVGECLAHEYAQSFDQAMRTPIVQAFGCHKTDFVTLLQCNGEIMANAAAATGLAFNDFMLQKPSRLRGMIYAAHIQAGMQMTKVSAKTHAEYLTTLDAIAKRLRAEKAERDAAAK